MARRSRQTIDRSKGGNLIRLNVWVEKDLARLARRALRAKGETMRSALESALRSLTTGATS